MNIRESDLGICCPHHPKVHFCLVGLRHCVIKVMADNADRGVKFLQKPPAQQDYSEYPKNSNTLFHTFLIKLCSLCSYFLKYFVEWQTVYNLIRVLLQEQSDLGLHCLHMPFNQKLRVQNFNTIPYYQVSTYKIIQIKHCVQM